jgi:hypothetical protein
MTSHADLTSESYIEERVNFKIEAYRKKGDRYRFWYLVTASTATISAASVPVLINGSANKLPPTILSLLVTVLVGLEGLFHFREHWRNYDLMKTFLRQELNVFRAGAGAYRTFPKGSPEALKLFVERIESEIARERSETIVMRTTREADRNGEPQE